MRRFYAAVGALALLLVVPAGTAVAAPEAGGGVAVAGSKVVSVTTTTGEGVDKYTSTLTLTFDKPLSAAGAKTVQSQYLTPASVSTSSVPLKADAASTGVTTTAAGPSGGTVIVCNRAYSWSDSRGTYSLQHACKGTTTPWGWQMAKPLRSTVVGTVLEDGMQWYVNGVKRTKQSPHNYAPSAVFHGNYSNTRAGNTVSYYDQFRYRHNIAGGGNAVITIGGDFKLGSDYLT